VYARRVPLGLAALALAGPAAAQTPLSPELQIRLAVQAAPPALRDSATVQGYDAAGTLVTLRRGTNAMICLAPDPRRPPLEVSCHHKGLEPFLARGRELLTQGVRGEQRTRTRWDEIAAGTLPLPQGAAIHILTGSGFDSATAEIRDPFLRWVVYLPGATSATTGLPEQPAGPGQPWLMFAGTPGAHIMITPPRGR
jgi:hypothetical protein